MYISVFIISITNLYFDYAFTNGDVLGFSIAAHDLYNKDDDNDNDNNGYRTNSSLESLSDHLLSRIKKTHLNRQPPIPQTFILTCIISSGKNSLKFNDFFAFSTSHTQF